MNSQMPIKLLFNRSVTVCMLVCLFWSMGMTFAQETLTVRKKINLPDFPEGAAYLLSRLSNDELLEVERQEAVYLAILIRDGLDLMVRMEAAKALSNTRGRTQLHQILDGLQRLEQFEEPHANTFIQLGHLLFKQPEDDLKQEKLPIQKMLGSSRHSQTRAILYAALIVIHQEVQSIWELASHSGADGKRGFLEGIQMIPDSGLLNQCYPLIQDLLQTSTSPPDLANAAMASAHITDKAQESFNTIKGLLLAGSQADGLIRALMMFQPKVWKEVALAPMMEWLVKEAKIYPIEGRSDVTFKLYRKFAEHLARYLPEAQANNLRKQFAAYGIRTLYLHVIPHVLQFDQKLLEVLKGEAVEIQIENSGVMPHNLVIGKPGSLLILGAAATQMMNRPEGRDGKKFVPDIPQTLLATPLIAPGQTETLRFVAPEIPGDYPYVCTYPGHWAQMNGILRVVE